MHCRNQGEMQVSDLEIRGLASERNGSVHEAGWGATLGVAHCKADQEAIHSVRNKFLYSVQAVPWSRRGIIFNQPVVD